MKFRSSTPMGICALLFSAVGRADLLDGSLCLNHTCQGSTYLLTYNPTPLGTFDTAGKIYDVFLTIDPTNYKSDQTSHLPSQIYIQTVAIKIANNDASSKDTLVAAPGGAAVWKLEDGGLSGSGGTADCNGSGAGFICAQDGKSAPVPFSGKYTWEWHYATTSPLLLGPYASSIKVAYTDGSTGTHGFKKVGSLVSEGITLQSSQPRRPVPDGGMTVMLLGGALVGLEALRRRFPT